MSTHLKVSIRNSERDNDYFTATIVGLPIEVALGRIYTPCQLNLNASISINAMTAKVWHSDAARALLREHIKPVPQKLKHSIFSRQAGDIVSVRTAFLGFVLGFVLCLALCYAYLPQPLTRAWLGL